MDGSWKQHPLVVEHSPISAVDNCHWTILFFCFVLFLSQSYTHGVCLKYRDVRSQGQPGKQTNLNSLSFLFDFVR